MLVVRSSPFRRQTTHWSGEGEGLGWHSPQTQNVAV
jgi:hypothetical protein